MTKTVNYEEVLLGDGSETNEFMNSARFRLKNINRSEWFPEVQRLLRERTYFDAHKLAVDAPLKSECESFSYFK